jgi:thioredoxin reductase
MTGGYDVTIVGGGPAGLSAALILGRSRRHVAVCDHGRPRNYAAQAVHGFLGMDGVSPVDIHKRGRQECAAYGVEFYDREVISGRCANDEGKSQFELVLKDGTVLLSRKLILATGVRDQLPEVAGIESFYGSTVHHCPYCDGWEHRDKRLAAYGKGTSAADLTIALLGWSRKVICCTDGTPITRKQRERLQKYGVDVRSEAIARLEGHERELRVIRFKDGSETPCDALFFSADQTQRSELPTVLGCECDEHGQIVTTGKHGSGVRGLFLAGDADGDVQFAIVAAAEGAVAATAVNAELQEEDFA